MYSRSFLRVERRFTAQCHSAILLLNAKPLSGGGGPIRIIPNLTSGVVDGRCSGSPGLRTDRPRSSGRHRGTRRHLDEVVLATQMDGPGRDDGRNDVATLGLSGGSGATRTQNNFFDVHAAGQRMDPAVHTQSWVAACADRLASSSGRCAGT